MDEEKLGRLLETYGALLRRTITRVCPRSRGFSVDDIEQEARVRLWRAVESEREITNPASYVRRIAVTATLDAIRRARSIREDSWDTRAPTDDDEAPTRPLELVADTRPSPEERAARAESREKLARALALLAPKRRRALTLHLRGFTTQEIGELCAWTEPKARNLVYRGMADLKRTLAAEGIDLEVG